MNPDKTIFAIIILITFLLPIFFLPWGSNIFVLNKQLLFIILASLGVLIWLIKSFYEKKLKIIRTPLDYFVIAFLFIYLLSFIFSLDKYQSLIDFLVVLCLGLFYFLIINNIKTAKQIKIILITFLTSLSIVSIFSLITLLGIFVLPFAFTKTAAFNTIGTQGSLTAILAISLPIAFIFLLQKQAKSIKNVLKQFLILAYILLILLVLNIINFKIGWITAFSGMIALLVFLTAKQKDLKLNRYFLWIPMLITIISLTVVLPYFIKIPAIVKPDLPSEVSLSKGLSWDIALKSATRSIPRIFIGTGPNTFSLNFSRFRPETFNNNSLWQIRFQNAQNYFSQTLASIGFLGLLIFTSLVIALILAGCFFFIKVKNNKNKLEQESSLYMGGLLASLIALIVAAYFSNLNIVLLFSFWLLASLIIKLGALSSKQAFTKFKISFSESSHGNLIASFLFVLGLCLVVFFYSVLIRIYLADLYYVQAKQILNQNLEEQDTEEQINQARTKLIQSVRYNKYNGLYNISLAQISALGAEFEANTKGDQADKDKLKLLMTQAINQSKRAIELSPNQISFYQARAGIFKTARSFTADAQEWLIKTYEQSIELEPSNPVFYYELGLIYRNKDQADLAQENLKKALELKSDFLDAGLVLANIFEAQEQIDQGISILQDMLALQVNQNNSRLYYEIGRLYFNKDEFDKSITYFETAISLSPQYANSLYSVSLAYEKKNNLEKAVEYMKKVAELNPDNKEVAKKLEQLKSQ